MEYINKWLASPASTPHLGWLNNKNREALYLLLDRIEASQNPKYLPVLKVWASDKQETRSNDSRGHWSATLLSNRRLVGIWTVFRCGRTDLLS